MKILFLAAEFPYPVNSGSRMRTWLFLEPLCEEHEISVMCFRSAGASSLPEEIKNKFDQILVVDDDFYLARREQHEPNIFRRVKNFVAGIPWEISTAFSGRFAETFGQVVASGQFDMIFARYVNMGMYLIGSERHGNLPTVIDIDDVEFKKTERRLAHETFGNRYARFRVQLNNKLFKRFHARLRRATLNIVCSEEDKKMLRRQCGLKNVEVVQNGIDTERYMSIGPYDQTAFESKTLLFCGSLNYFPNIDALDWFCNLVFPRITKREPGTVLRIVGSCADEARAHSRFDGMPNVELHLNVADVRPYYRSSAVVVVPIRIGGGTRIKALEAMACQRPIVSTTIGVEGLELSEGGYCAIGDTPEEFGNACMRLLSAYESSRELTERGLAFVMSRYDSIVIQRRVQEICRLVARGSKSTEKAGAMPSKAQETDNTLQARFRSKH